LKRLLALVLLLVCILAGCASNQDMEPSSNVSEYQSQAKILCSFTFNPEDIPSHFGIVFSSSLHVCTELLQSSFIQNKIREAYPDLEYTLTIEQLDETEMYAIIATSQNPEGLEELCNMAASLFCERFQEVIEDASAKIIAPATAAQLVETN
jgi:capsular polysaccharide biosynthesis protein